jgi:type I restriction enzyme S subunit
MFGDLKSNSKMWNFFLLKDVCTVIVDCPHSTPVKSTFPTSYPCIRTSELKNGQIVWKSMQYVDEIEYKKRIARLKPRKGDIVYGREGSYGDAVCLPGGFDFCLGQRTMLFRPNSKVIESVFLLYTLLSDFVYDQAKLKNSGSTVGHVNVADIKKFKIPLPPIEKQQTFIGNIVIIESQKSLLHQSLTDTQQIFDYTMNKYFGS